MNWINWMAQRSFTRNSCKAGKIKYVDDWIVCHANLQTQQLAKRIRDIKWPDSLSHFYFSTDWRLTTFAGAEIVKPGVKSDISDSPVSCTAEHYMVRNYQDGYPSLNLLLFFENFQTNSKIQKFKRSRNLKNLKNLV